MASEANHQLQTDRTLLEAEAVRRLFLTQDGVAQLMPVMPLLIVLSFWNHVDHRLLLVWFVFATAMPAWRFLLSRRYKKTAPDASKARYWAQLMTLNTFLDGSTWGAAGVLFFMPDALPQQLLLFAFIIGFPAASLFTASWWPPSLYASAYPMVGMTAIGALTAGYLGLGVMLIVYMIILHQLMRKTNAAAMETIALRFENLDLIEQLREEKRLAEDADRAKSQFLAAASHDLRQPLHALGLFVEALNERIRYPEARTIMDNINHSVTALEGLFDALLDISRLDAGIVVAEPQHVLLRPLLEQLNTEFAAEARNKGLDWQVDMTDVAVVTDPALLGRVLRNLLSNAVRYTKTGKVSLACRVEQDKVIINVADSGRGIPAEYQQDVFREFFQLHNPERDRNKGLGLGLSIVRRLMTLLGHPYEMQSQPGEGTVFQLTLPLGDSAAVKPMATEQAAPGEEFVQARILVIDDEAAVRESMQLLLAGWGYTVITASSADEALSLLDAAPAVIIADYRLRNEETGDDAINRVQAVWGKDIPALIITGDTAPERLSQAQHSGYAFLLKPVPPARLRAFLRTTLSYRTAPQ
jgi:signal transduction histidine kinase/CheY-like chemotaxis protein